MSFDQLPRTLRLQFYLINVIMNLNWYAAIGILATTCSVLLGSSAVIFVMVLAVVLMAGRAISYEQARSITGQLRDRLIKRWMLLETTATIIAIGLPIIAISGWSGTILGWTMVATVVVNNRLLKWAAQRAQHIREALNQLPRD